jgi:deoxycytidylate deaminase
VNSLLNIGYFKLARNISKFSDHSIRVGCIIAKKKPFSAACNLNKTHPSNLGTFQKSFHAEYRAVTISGKYDLIGATVYVYREDHNGNPMLARPCNNCYNLLRKRGIRRIFFSISEFPYYICEKI